MAVLYRAHYHSMEVQLEFTRRGIPFAITSGLRFFEQAHVKDVAAFLRFAVNPRDEIAFKRMVKLFPGIGRSPPKSLWNQANAKLDGRRDIASASRSSPSVQGAGFLGRSSFSTMMELAPAGGSVAPSAMIESVRSPSTTTT